MNDRDAARRLLFGEQTTELPDASHALLAGAAQRLAAHFSPQDVGRFMLGDFQHAGARPDLSVELVDKQGRERSFTPPLEMARPLFGAGMQLVIRHIDRTHPRLAAIAASIADLFGSSPERVDVRFSPSGTTWRYEARGVAFVFQSQGSTTVTIANHGALELAAADALYLPAGSSAAVATQETSYQVAVLLAPR